MSEHLEPELSPFLCPLAGRSRGPGVREGRRALEEAFGPLWPFKCYQNDSCSPDCCLRLSDTHQGQGCASAPDTAITASNGL